MHDDVRFLDLLRHWLAGDVRRAAEREMRTLAEADDFRREAMEGFEALPEADHVARLAVLRARLRAQNQRTSTRFLTMPRMMAAAAALALVVAAVVFLPQIFDEKADVGIAQTAPSAAPEPQSTAPIAAQPQVLEEKTATTDGPIALRSAPATSQPKSEVPRAAAPVGEPAASGTAAASQPAADAVVADDALSMQATEVVVQSESTENEAFAKQKERAAPAGAAPAKPTTEATKDYARPAERAKKSSAPPAPAVQHKTDAKPDMSKLRDKPAAPAPPEPVGGWDVFKEYLRENARLTAEAKQKKVRGKVRLQFVVNPNGEPFNFLIIKSLGYGCDEEAVRLVKDLEWQPGVPNTVTVEVEFNR